MYKSDEIFMKLAIELSQKAVEHGNEPFGAVLVKMVMWFIRMKIRFILCMILLFMERPV